MRRHRSELTSQEVIVTGFCDLEPIGDGGFSHVYRAKQASLGRQVALKVLNAGLDTSLKQKAFERECRAMGTLSQHPNIVTVFSAAFSTDGRPCIVMEFYEGGTLGQEVKDTGPLPPADVISIGIKLCDALDAAHSAGIVHRDIKPLNLFRSAYAGVVLGDFGISSFDDDRTITRSSNGLTVHYAPPELIEGGSASARSDIYSLAASLYYLVTGERPFPRSPGETSVDVARRILLQPAPVFDKNGPGQGLGRLLARAMAKDPTNRPVSAVALRGELVALLDAPPPPSATPARVATPPLDVGPDATETETGTETAPRLRTPIVSRPNRSLALGAGAVLGVGALIWFGVASGGGDQAARLSTPATTVANDDTFFGAPATPRGVSVVPVDGGYEIAWMASNGASSYEVERISASSRPTLVDSTSVVVPGDPNERPCFVVRSVGSSGLLSLDSEPLCAD